MIELCGVELRGPVLNGSGTFRRRGDRVSTRDKAPKHPKSTLQEWAAANNRKPPVYQLTDRSGPHHVVQANRPPGRSTRCASAMARSGSARW